MYSTTRSTCFVFFNDTATTEICTLSLHDALPIAAAGPRGGGRPRHADDAAARDPPRRARGALRRPRGERPVRLLPADLPGQRDRKSTRLNSSHANISYAVFCLKKKESVLIPVHLS